MIEYGTDRSGYLQRLIDLVPPQIAIITALGPAHLQGMGSMEAIVREKGTLLRGVPPPRVVILAEDHNYIDQLEAYAVSPVIRVGGPGVELALRIARIVASRLRVPEAALQAASDLKPLEHRLRQFDTGGIRVIDDSFNGNPLSMQLGLDTLASAAPEGHRRIAVLGTMAELGDDSRQYHVAIGQYSRHCADLIIGVGEMASDYTPDFLFPDSDSCASAIDNLLQPGDHVLIKGSASVGMDKIVERLLHLPNHQQTASS